MKTTGRLLLFVLVALCWLLGGGVDHACAQMTAVINTLADDDFSHPWDDPNTPEDESSDGICEDELHRCTARAAVEEAWNMNNSNGVPLDLTVNLPGLLSLVFEFGSLSLPDGSNLHGNLQTTIAAGFSAVEVGYNTAVRGLKFIGGYPGGGNVGIGISGDGNTISGNVFDGLTLAGLIVGGVQNVIGGSTPADRNIFTNCTDGIFLIGDNNVVVGNYIGIDVHGDVAGNLRGIFDSGRNNTIGGTDAGMRNVISGNTLSGVTVSAADPSLTGISTIIGNYIGTDPTGTQSRPNLFGIQVSIGRALIGGPLPAERNIISGNTAAGIETRGDALTVRVVGNDIGLDVAGLPLGNRDGIDLSPGSFDGVIEGNRISNNSQFGIYSRGTLQDPSWNHRIRGNEIAMNGAAGIVLDRFTTDVVIGSSLTQDFDPNHIHDNGLSGVVLQGTMNEIPRANTIRKNDFHENGQYGINIYYLPSQDGIRPPTVHNYADIGGGTAIVTVSHHRPGSLIDVYTGEMNKNSRYEGRQWLGSGIVVDSLVPFGFAINACACTHIVATATDQAENTSEFSNGFAITTDVPPEHDIRPTMFSLENAYPNPFNPSTTIRYQLPRQSQVTLKVYDVLGREVTTLVDGVDEAGFKQVQWDAKSVSSGVYFYQMRAGSFAQTRKMLLVR